MAHSLAAQSPIIQAAQFADCLGARAPECTEANFGPVGTGPFVVTDFKPNDVIQLVANDNYRDPNKPAFASMTFKGGGSAEASGRAVTGNRRIRLRLEPTDWHQTSSRKWLKAAKVCQFLHSAHLLSVWK